jgi:hypothetical protein
MCFCMGSRLGKVVGGGQVGQNKTRQAIVSGTPVNCFFLQISVL